MSRHLKLRRAERARLRATASTLGDLLGWHRQQAGAFLEVLACSPWRHCRRSESEWVLTVFHEFTGPPGQASGRCAAGARGATDASGE